MAGSVETERAELATSRALVYGVLASLYSRPAGAPELEVLRRWCDIDGDLVGDLFPGVAGRGLESIRDWFKQGAETESPGECTALLESEFVRLFRGLRRGTSPPPPYQSVYVDGGTLWGPSADRVGSKYLQFNLSVQSNEPPDHLALEFEFMRFLCTKEAEARDGGHVVLDWLEEQNAFLGEQLAPWLPDLCERIRGSCESQFYRGLADLTEGWATSDVEIVRELLDLELTYVASGSQI